jgi:DNA-binding PadR family transcriptional regulator
MSLRHAILGLLADHPDTGYDLAKRFDGMLSGFAWHASHSQIYPELKRMTADGLIEVISEGARHSRTYTVTDAGRAELRRWMFVPQTITPARNEHVLRLLSLASLDLDDTRVLVERLVTTNDELTAALRAGLAEFRQRTSPGARPGYSALALEFAVRYLDLECDWARWMLAELEKHTAGG